MKILSRGLSYLSAFFAILTLVHSRSGKANSVLYIPQLFAGALSPFLAIAGGLGALSGSVRKDRQAVWAGLLGTMVAVRHILKVTAQHDGFNHHPRRTTLPAHLVVAGGARRQRYDARRATFVPCSA